MWNHKEQFCKIYEYFAVDHYSICLYILKNKNKKAFPRKPLSAV